MVFSIRVRSRSAGPRPLATRHTRFAPAWIAASATSAALSGLIQEYLSTSALDPTRCEQYPQSSGHRPLFMLMIVLSLTRLPKNSRRTRAPAATTSMSGSVPASRARASSRVGAWRRIALSANRSSISLGMVSQSTSRLNTVQVWVLPAGLP